MVGIADGLMGRDGRLIAGLHAMRGGFPP